MNVFYLVLCCIHICLHDVIEKKAFGDNDDSIYCGKCNLWLHIKCNNLNFIDYQYLTENDDPWFCLKCNSELFPFGTLSNKKI